MYVWSHVSVSLGNVPCFPQKTKINKRKQANGKKTAKGKEKNKIRKHNKIPFKKENKKVLFQENTYGGGLELCKGPMQIKKPVVNNKMPYL